MIKREICPVCNKPFAVFNIMPDGRNQYIHRATAEKGRQFITSHYTREVPIPEKKIQLGDIIAERLQLYINQSEVNSEAMKQLIIQASAPVTEDNYSLTFDIALNLILETAKRQIGSLYEQAYIRMKLALKLTEEESDRLKVTIVENFGTEDFLAATIICEKRKMAALDLGLDPLTPFQSL